MTGKAGRQRTLDYRLVPRRTTVITYEKITDDYRERAGESANVSKLIRDRMADVLGHPSLKVPAAERALTRAKADLEAARKWGLEQVRTRFDLWKKSSATAPPPRGGRGVKHPALDWCKDELRRNALLRERFVTPAALLGVLDGANLEDKHEELERQVAARERELIRLRILVAEAVQKMMGEAVGRCRAWTERLGHEPAPAELIVWLEAGTLLEEYRLIGGIPDATFEDFLKAFLAEKGPPPT